MKKNLLSILTVLSIILMTFFVACSDNGGKKGNVKDVSITEFSEIIQSGDSVIILDVSIDSAYNNVLIQGAIAYPISNEKDAEMVVEEFGVSVPYAIYASKASDSKDAAAHLEKKGVKVYNMKDGLGDWIEEDEEIVVIAVDSVSNTMVPIKTTKSKIMSDSTMMNHPAMQKIVNPNCNIQNKQNNCSNGSSCNNN